MDDCIRKLIRLCRTTTQDMLQEDSKMVDLFKHDLYKLEQELGHNDIEMYIRQMKMELRCARSLADEQVIISCLWIHRLLSVVSIQPWGEIFAPAPTDQWKWPI